MRGKPLWSPWLVGAALLVASALAAQDAPKPGVEPMPADQIVARVAIRAEQWGEVQPCIGLLGPENVPVLLDLAAAGDQATARAAMRVLDYLIGSAVGPRRAKLVKAVATALEANPGPADAVKRLLLDLCARQGTPDAVAALESLLAEPLWREPARRALVNIPGTDSLRALRRGLQAALLTNSDAGWTNALVVALGAKGDREALPMIVGRLGERRTQTALAAIEALRLIGDPQVVPALEALWTNRDARRRDAAIDALLDLVPRLEDKAAAAAKLTGWLTSGLTPHYHCAALSALAQVSSGAAVTRLVADLEHASAAVRQHARQVLAGLEGPEVTDKLAVALPQAKPETQMALVLALAERAEDKATPVFVSLLDSTDAAVRRAVLLALGRHGSAAAIKPLAAQWEKEQGDLRTLTARALLLVGGRLCAKDPDAGRAALLQGLRLADNDALRVLGLTLLTPVASPELWPVVEPMVRHQVLGPAAGEVALAIGEQLSAKGKRKDAIAVFQAILAGGDRQLSPLASARLAELDVIPEPARERGCLTRWWLLGTFANNNNAAAHQSYAPEKEVNVAAPVPVDGKQLRWRWQPINDPSGICNLLPLFTPNTEVAVYAYTEITVHAAQDAQLRVGSDDGCILWLNGDEVYCVEPARSLVPDQDTVNVRLRPGRNRLLAKVLQEQGDWGFVIRLLRPNGELLTFDPPSAPKPAPAVPPAAAPKPAAK